MDCFVDCSVDSTKNWANHFGKFKGTAGTAGMHSDHVETSVIAVNEAEVSVTCIDMNSTSGSSTSTSSTLNGD